MTDDPVLEARRLLAEHYGAERWAHDCVVCGHSLDNMGPDQHECDLTGRAQPRGIRT